MSLLDWEFSYKDFVFGGASEFGVLEVEGLAPPDTKEEVVDRAADHGAFVSAKYLQHRRITVTGDFHTNQQFEHKVDKFRSLFLPQETPQPLDFKFGGIGMRRIYCVPVRTHFVVNPLYSIKVMRWTVQFVAPDPRIFDSHERTATTGPLTTQGSFGFPVGFDVTFGSIPNQGIVEVVNEGIFEAPFVLRVDGPALRPRLVNITHGLELIVDMELLTGQYLLVDTADRTVLLNGVASRYSALPITHKWWHMQPGYQKVQFFTESQAGSTESQLSWRSAWV